MTIRILAAALCCLLAAACASPRDVEWGQSGNILTYTERAR